MLQFTTTSKRLEEFLYVHLIQWRSSYTNEDGDTVWVYDKTDEFERVLAEFREIQKRRVSRIIK